MALDDFDQPPLENGSPGQKVISHGAEGVEVASRIGRQSVLDRLGRKVLRCSGENVFPREPDVVRPLQILDEPEIDDLRKVRDAP
jgi:hypothetical protein